MRYYMLSFAVVTVLALLCAGCGEGPVFHEDQRVLSRAVAAPTEDKQGEDVSDDASQWDPEARKERRQEEEEKAQEEKEEIERQEDIKDAGQIADVLIKHIYEMEFDKAIEEFEKYQEAFVKVAEENMIHPDSRVREGYKLWMDEIIRAVEILKDETLDNEKKKSKAQTAIVNAGRGKQGAELAKRQE